MITVLFVCPGSANLSQVAAAYARRHGDGLINVFSAGIRLPKRAHTKTIAAMNEVDLVLESPQRNLEFYRGRTVDVVVTLGCEGVTLPLTARERFDWPIEDRPRMILQDVRDCRDLIEVRVKLLIKKLKERVLRRAVLAHSSAAAQSGLSVKDADVRTVALAQGYDEQELESVPAESYLGMSCGNPLASANLQPGEVVVDLGSGAGLDVLLAASQVAPDGRAIGIDFCKDMVELARQNAIRMQQSNACFHQSPIDRLPLDSATVDCVISNCAINQALDKAATFREVYRILKPGGRIALTDTALKQPLPAELSSDLKAYLGCLSGALLIPDYRQTIRSAGFVGVQVIDNRMDFRVYGQVPAQLACLCPVGAPTETLEPLQEFADHHDLNEYAASVRILAFKPD